MDPQLSQGMFNSCDLNANQNEMNDDEPSPPPGLSRLVTGQTVSFDDGSNSPPFDRVIPGEGREYSAPYQAFSPPSKTSTTSGNNFFNNNSHNSSSHEFFDNYLRNSNANDIETKVNQPAKNKYGNHFFPSHEGEKREIYFHNDVPRIPSTLFDNVGNKSANNPFTNFHTISSNPPPPCKPLLKAVENVQYDGTSQQRVPVMKPDNVSQFENNFPVPQHDNEQIIENKEKVSFFPQNDFGVNAENGGAKNELINHNPTSDRMAIEGSSDNVSHSKAVTTSTPISSPNYDHWYSSPNSRVKDSRPSKEQSSFYANMYAAEKPNNLQNIPPSQSVTPFNILGPLQNPQDATNLHSKTPSVSSNNSSNNEAFGYQRPDNYMALKRNDHFSNVETSENNAISSLHDVHTNNVSKTNIDRPTKILETRKNESTIESRHVPKLDANRENYKNVDEDERREIVQHSDSDERSSISPRMVEGYTYNTIPGPRKNLDRNSKLHKPYQFESSRSKGSKIEPPLDQRMVEGKTSSDAPAVQVVSRVRDDRHYDEEQSRPSSRVPRHAGADSVSGRSDKNRKKLLHNSRQDRRKIESEDEDYDESANHDFRRYRGKHYRDISPPRYSNKSSSRRHRDSSFTHSQDESFYDDDDDDYFDRCRNSRKYNDSGRSHREPPLNFRPQRDPYYYGRSEKYRGPEYSYRYDVNPYYQQMNSRPSSRSGSEYRSLEYSHQHSIKLPPGYEYLVPRRCDGPEVNKWLEMRYTDPRAYSNWFRITFPQEYELWYHEHYEKNKKFPADSHQPDRRGSGHSGRSSVNDDTLGANGGKIRANEHSMFKPVESKVTTDIHEIRRSPAKFTIPHVKGVFNALGQLIVINACSPQDGVPARVDVRQLNQPDDDPDLVEFMNFTGPFILGETHVNNVADFLKYHASRTSVPSEKLLYLLIDLIITLRGVTDGIAISDLLMKSYRESQNHTVAFMNCASNGSSNLMETEIIEKYRNLLLQGDKNSALAWAISHKVWGHAFLLASKMGTKAYDRVLAEFDSSISINCPLKTLYQFYSNQIPLAATACSDEKWGDWRPHLAMILSNLTDDNQLNKNAIVTLGDSLAYRDVFASHFCYLVAQVDFESPNKPSSKFSLISLRNNVDHFGVNTSNHAILLTQTYEFAKRLLRKDYTISSLLPYKYLLATRLIDYGKTNVALQYLESIALDLIKDPSDQNLDLVCNVLELSERIKYSDSKSLVAGSATEKQWLIDLRDVVKDRLNKPPDTLCNDQYTNKEQLYSDQSYQQNFSPQPLTHPLPSIHSQTPQHQSAFSPAGDVQPSIAMFSTSTANQQQLFPSLPTPNQNQSWEKPIDLGSWSGHSMQNQYQPVPNNPPSFNVNEADYNQTANTETEANYSPWDQSSQIASISMHSRNNYFEDPDSRPKKTSVKHNVSKTKVLRPNALKKYEVVRGNVKRLRGKNYNFGNEYPSNALSSASTNRETHLFATYFGDKLVLRDNLSTSYYNSLCNSKIVFNGTFPIDKPFGIRENLCDTKLQTANDGNAQSRNPPSQTPQPANKGTEKSSQENKSENSGNSGGWFNSLFKRKHQQAILPDDKNKSIVFDREKNRWVDLNEKDDDSANAIKPPPKASELQTFQPMLSDQQPVRRNEIPQAPNTQQFANQNTFPASNMKNGGYTLKGKGMKSNYVNVLSNNTINAPAPGTSPQPVAMMNAASAQVPPTNMNLFSPPSFDSGASSVSENMNNLRLSENVPQSRGMNQDMPMFFNPAQYKSLG